MRKPFNFSDTGLQWKRQTNFTQVISEIVWTEIFNIPDTKNSFDISYYVAAFSVSPFEN